MIDLYEVIDTTLHVNEAEGIFKPQTDEEIKLHAKEALYQRLIEEHTWSYSKSYITNSDLGVTDSLARRTANKYLPSDKKISVLYVGGFSNLQDLDDLKLVDSKNGVELFYIFKFYTAKCKEFDLLISAAYRPSNPNIISFSYMYAWLRNKKGRE